MRVYESNLVLDLIIDHALSSYASLIINVPIQAIGLIMWVTDHNVCFIVHKEYSSYTL